MVRTSATHRRHSRPLRDFLPMCISSATNAFAETGAASCCRASSQRSAREVALRYDMSRVWTPPFRRRGPAHVPGPAFGRLSASGRIFTACAYRKDVAVSRLCEFVSTHSVPTDASDTTDAKIHTFRETTFSGVDGPRRRRLFRAVRTRSVRSRGSGGQQVDARDALRRRRLVALAAGPPRRRHAPRTRPGGHGALMGRKRPWSGRFPAPQGSFCRSWRS